MNKLFLASIFSLMTFVGHAQSSISIDPSFMLKASFHGSNNGDWIHRVTQLKVMVLDGKKAADAAQWTRISHDLHDQRFEDLFSVRKGGDRLQLLSKDGKDGLKELAFLAGDKDGGLFISFAGKFTAHDLEQMRSALQDNNKDDQ